MDHPILVITEVLKGNPPTKELPIVIPGSGAYMILQKDHTIWEGGSMSHPICGDIRQDQIWFLRTDTKKESSVEKGSNALQIFEPGDIQPVELKPYYLALLADDPDKALQSLITGNPQLAERAKGSLDYLAVQRIEKMPDPEKRIDQLIPYFVAANGDPGNVRNEAMAQIEACGALGAKKLGSVFFDVKPGYEQVFIMAFWQQIGYREGTPILSEMLEREDQFWSIQDMHDKSWYPNIPGTLSMAKNESFNKILFAMRTLNILGGGDQATPAVEMTKKRWNSYDPTGAHELIKECDGWLGATK